MSHLIDLDLLIFHWINTGWSNSLIDIALPYLSHLHTMPIFKFGILPMGLGFWFWRKRKKALKTFLGLVIVVALSDSIAYRLLKPSFDRVRPNNVAELNVNLRVYGPKSGSFPSNHATNGFAAANALSYFYPQLKALYFGLAVVVGLSRVYGGVHYPSDLLGGWLIGFLLSFAIIRLFIDRLKFFKDVKE